MVDSGDVRRLFLQAVLSRGVVSEKLAQTLWLKSVEAVKAVNDELDIPSDPRDWENFVNQVNESLNSLAFEFKPLQDEVSGKLMYGFVNMKGDEIAQMATEYTANEIAFFKIIVELVMLAPNESFSVSSLAALREVSSLPGKGSMTKSQGEVVLDSFVANGWLLKSKKGRYSLSTRSLLELHSYLKTTYPNELIECTICMEILTQGVACHTANCKTRLHHHCLVKYRRRNNTCPSCTQEWPADPRGLAPVGETAAKPGQEARRRVRRSQAADSDKEDEDASQEPQAPTQSQMDNEEDEPAPTRSSRRKGRR